MKKALLAIAVMIMVCNNLYAQFSEFRNNDEPPSNFTLNSDNNTLQFGGRASAYYEDRWLKPGQVNKSHNGIALKDADFDILGKTASKFVYELQVSFLDLANAAATQNTANNQAPGIKAAYVSYEGWPVLVKLGYDKLPYSMGSLNDAYTTPFWSHSNLSGGDMFSRRDLGLTLNYRALKKCLNIYGGVYTGLGENVFEYGNDASARPEFVGRIDYSFPSRYRYDAIDMESSPKPVFRIGVNARYTDKTQPTGRSIAADEPDAPGAFGLRMINGKKLVYGGDFIAKWKGLSVLFETDIINMHPADPTDALFMGTTESVNNKIVKAGGICTGINYNWKQIKSVFSVQYENYNVNDLAPGHEEWLYLGYAYTVSGFNSVIKVEYYKPLKEDVVSDPLKWTDQLRVGYQIVF